MKGAEETRTSCLLSRLELLQPLDRCGASTDHGRGRGHEEQAGQQCQGEDEPLGIHGEGSSVQVKARSLKEGRTGGYHCVPWNPRLYMSVFPPRGGGISMKLFAGFVIAPPFLEKIGVL